MRISQKITALIGATLVGSVILAAIFTTIFVLIYDREQKSGNTSADLQAVTSFTEKSRSLLMYYDVASQSDGNSAGLMQLLIDEGFSKSRKSLESARDTVEDADRFDFDAVASELDRLKLTGSQAIENPGDTSLRDALAVYISSFRGTLEELDQTALALAMENRSKSNTFKYVAIGIVATIAIGFVVVIMWVRTRTVQDIVDPIVDLSEAASTSHQNGSRLQVLPRGPEEIRSLIDGVSVFANNLRDLVDDRTERLEEANKELAKQAEIANAKAAEASELARQAKEASESKSSFLANMSHEIRTPLNGILGMLSLLEDMNNKKDQEDLIQTAQDSAKSLLGIVNEILDFSKIEANAIEIEEIEFDLRESVYGATDLVALKAQEKHLDLVAKIAHDVPRKLIGDPLRIRQLCTNLLGNSLKFTEKGTVMVAVSKAAVQPSKGLRLRFEISDTGMGIPPEKVNSLFDPYSQVDASTTRNFGGTGLGLNICKKLAELMGGEIGVTSTLGEGSIFWFEIQSAEDAANWKSELEHYPIEDAGRPIICEPHKELAISLEQSLKAYSVDATIVSEEETLFAKIKEGLDSGHVFNRVFIDTRIGDAKAEMLAQRVKVTSGLASPAIVALSLIGASRGEKTNFTGQISKPVKELPLLSSVFDRSIGKDESEQDVEKPKKLAEQNSFNRSVRILVAEDNKVNQKVIRMMLKRAGLGCELANDGREAIERLGSSPYDLVFMDCQMPNLDGFEATREIRKSSETFKGVPIVALTANALKGYEEKCFEAGMSDFITKPIDPKNLVSILNKWAPLDPQS